MAGPTLRLTTAALVLFPLVGDVGCDRGRRGASGPGTASTVVLAEAGAPEAGVVTPEPRTDAGAASRDAGAPARRADLNLLVLSIDSLRADMPWAGYPRPIAPRLTELEAKSVSYTRAYAISSYTSMSLGGFLGGKLPSGMKRSGYFFGTYAPENVMFPELLQKAGVKTLSAHAHGYFKSAGFEQGFDAWELVPNIVFKNETDPNVTGPQHELIAERLLGDPALETRRFFAWFHFLDPHDQYVSHEAEGIPPYGKTLRDRYDAEVTFTDRQIGKLLDFVAKKSWGARTAILVTADHGESFGEHNHFAHGFELWENLVRVPMFFFVPGAAPRKIDTPRSAIDLAPTICELFGVAPDPGFEGKSLVPELHGAPADPRDVILDLPMTSDNDKRRALVRGDLKMIGFGKEEAVRLFDVGKDPDEKTPVRGEAFEDMQKRYRAASKGIKEVPPYGCGEKCLNRAYMKK